MIWIASILGAGSVHYNFDYVLLQWLLGLGVISAFLSYAIFLRYDLIPAITLFYFLCNGLVGSMTSLAALILIVAFCALMDPQHRLFLRRCLPTITIVNSIYVICGAVTGGGRLPQGEGFSGFLDYSGMNGCLIAALIPTLFGCDKRVAISGTILGVIAVILSKASIPYGVLVVSVGAYFLHRHKIGWLTACSLCAVLLAFCSEGFKLFDNAFRFQAYKVFMLDWWQNHSHLFGAGLGTFPMLSPAIQERTGFMMQMNEAKTSFYWPWLHSDWLQTIFESGFIGFALAAFTVFHSLYLLYKKDGRSEVFAMGCGIAASAVFDFPVRYMLIAFLAVFTIFEAHQPQEQI